MTDRLLAHRERLVTEANSRWWTLGAMCFALFMIMLDNTVVNVALPSIQRDLHASLSSLEWTMNAYTLTFAVLLVTGGRLGDIFGRRKMFLFGVTVFGISSAAIGFAPNDAVLVSFRAVQGIGAAFMMPATLSIITQTFPAEQRGMAIGTWAGVSALALAIGPVVGGFLTQDVSWRAIFFINPPIAVGAVAVTLFATRESRDETVGRKVDFAGIAALTVGLTALVLGLVESNSWHWGSARVVGLFVIAVVALVAFVVIELRVRVPMLDFAFFRSRTSAGLEHRCVPDHVRDVRPVLLPDAVHAERAALRPAADGAALLAGDARDHRHGSTRRSPHRQGWAPALDGLGLLLTGSALLIQSRITIHTGYGLLLPGFILMGLGMGMVMSPMSTAAMNAVDRTKAGAASGVLSMSRMVGGSVGLAVMGALVATIGRSKLNMSLPELSAGVRSKIASSLGSGVVHGVPNASHHVIQAVQQAFVSALGTGLEVGAAVSVLGAVLALVLVGPLANRPKPLAAREALENEAPATEVTVG